ncbi:MAG: CARDB domain-containing protein, partial [Candidatus Thermoplasmatota archaeon]
NTGKSAAMYNVSFYDGPESDGIYIGNVTNSSVPALGERDVIFRGWTARPGGVHVITVNLTVQKGYADADLDNSLSRNITVLPKILLVDDDRHANDGSDEDTLRFMRAALEAANFHYDFYAPLTLDGPAYDTGDVKIKEYDVVIWMTGYQTTNTLTSTDVNNLRSFLNNSGSLWLVSKGLLKEYMDDPGKGYIGSFATTDLLLTGWAYADPVQQPLAGLEGDPVTDYLFQSNTTLTLIERVPGEDDGCSVLGNLSLVDAATGLIGYAAKRNDTARVYFTPWEFSRIMRTSKQAQFTYRVLTWLSGVATQFGDDLAVAEQTITPETVFYKQPVIINATIRNNGFRNLNTTVALRVYLGGSAVPYHTNETGTIEVLTGDAGEVEVSFLWIPEFVGAHRIEVMVDPRGYITETNEENNVASEFLFGGEIDVKFRTLVVDDDQVAGGETEEFIAAFTALGYEYERWNISAPTESGPPRNVLVDYNAIIWICGDTADSLTSWDITNLTAYLGISGSNLWLIGKNALGNVIDAFEQD